MQSLSPLERRRRLSFLTTAALSLGAASVRAAQTDEQQPARGAHVGEPAPPLVVEVWLNAPAEVPSLESLRGRSVLIEFWGTSLKACMKTIPHAQAFHDRYGELGLTVFAISYDQPDVLRRLIDARGYTIPIGSDSAMKNYQVWGVPEVPTACLIDAAGHIAYYGAPEACDLAIERQLGLESSPTALLDAYLAPSAGADAEAARRELLDRLMAKAARSFDLRAWAARRCETPAEATAPVEASAGASEPDPGALLSEYARAAWSGEDERRGQLLCTLAASGARAFDLKRWTRSELAHSHPLELAELEQLLGAGRQELALDGLLFRAATPEARQYAAGDAGFVKHCASATLEARSHARKGLLVQYWVFPAVEPRSRQRLWADLGIGGLPPGFAATTNFSVGTERVDPDSISSFVDEQFLRYLLTSSYASSRPVDPATLGPRVQSERARMLAELVERHGGVVLTRD